MPSVPVEADAVLSVSYAFVEKLYNKTDSDRLIEFT